MPGQILPVDQPALPRCLAAWISPVTVVAVLTCLCGCGRDFATESAERWTKISESSLRDVPVSSGAAASFIADPTFRSTNTADWRTSFEAFRRNFTSRRTEDGRHVFDWGEFEELRKKQEAEIIRNGSGTFITQDQSNGTERLMIVDWQLFLRSTKMPGNGAISTAEFDSPPIAGLRLQFMAGDAIFRQFKPGEKVRVIGKIDFMDDLLQISVWPYDSPSVPADVRALAPRRPRRADD